MFLLIRVLLLDTFVMYIHTYSKVTAVFLRFERQMPLHLQNV